METQDSPVVWVVDDSALDAEVARRALSPDYQVVLFTDGTSALEQLSAHAAPDVLLLDWLMPSLTGLDVCRFIRSAEASWSGLPIVLLTVYQHTEHIVEGLAAGANDFLSKPYLPEELQARVAARIREQRLLVRAERAEAGLRVLLEQSPDPIIALGADLRVSFVNAETCVLLGCPKRELVGRRVDELLPEMKETSLLMDRAAAPDVTLGERIFAPAIRRLGDDSVSVIITLRDVTDRRLADRRRLDFYSILAHDLRGPLSATLLRTDGMLRGRKGVLPENVTHEVERIGASTRSLVSLVNDFLDLARLQGTNYEIEHDPVDISGVIGSTVDELRPLLDANRVNLTFVPPTGAITVTGDRRRLTQVASNLIGNAIKFTPSGGQIEIGISSFPSYIETVVRDTGPGIPADMLPRLFERFTRGAGQAAGGTGLGLMIVREIVQAHGGTVGVESRVGEGSRFWFRLPNGALPA